MEQNGRKREDVLLCARCDIVKTLASREAEIASSGVLNFPTENRESLVVSPEPENRSGRGSEESGRFQGGGRRSVVVRSQTNCS